jgi:hypothetical protein
LPRVKEPLRFGSTRAKFTRGNMVSTLRGKAMNIASRGSRTQSISGFRHSMAIISENIEQNVEDKIYIYLRSDVEIP